MFWAEGFWGEDFWIDDFWLGMGDSGGGDDPPGTEWEVRRTQLGTPRPVRISTRVRPVRFPNPRR